MLNDHNRMSNRKQWENIYAKSSKKKGGKKQTETEDDFITEQLLSAQFYGKVQKY